MFAWRRSGFIISGIRSSARKWDVIYDSVFSLVYGYWLPVDGGFIVPEYILKSTEGGYTI